MVALTNKPSTKEAEARGLVKDSLVDTAKPYCKKIANQPSRLPTSFRMEYCKARAGRLNRLSGSLCSMGTVRMQSQVLTVQGLQSKQKNPWRAELSARLKKEELPWEPVTNCQLINRTGATYPDHSFRSHLQQLRLS